MAGHMGARNRTQQNLEIVRTDAERGLLFVKGSVPGSKGGCLLVRDAVKLPRHPEAPYPAGLKSAANTNDAPAAAPVETPVDETVVDTAATDGAQANCSCRSRLRPSMARRAATAHLTKPNSAA